jgi:hypothetical protein
VELCGEKLVAKKKKENGGKRRGEKEKHQIFVSFHVRQSFFKQKDVELKKRYIFSTKTY